MRGDEIVEHCGGAALDGMRPAVVGAAGSGEPCREGSRTAHQSMRRRSLAPP